MFAPRDRQRVQAVMECFWASIQQGNLFFMIRRVTMRGGAGSCVDWNRSAADANATDAHASAHAENRTATLPLRRINQACRSPVATAPMASHLRWPVVFDLIGLGRHSGSPRSAGLRDLGRSIRAASFRQNSACERRKRGLAWASPDQM